MVKVQETINFKKSGKRITIFMSSIYTFQLEVKQNSRLKKTGIN